MDSVIVTTIPVDQAWRSIKADEAKLIKGIICDAFPGLNPRVVGAMFPTCGEYEGYVLAKFFNKQKEYVFGYDPDTEKCFLMEGKC